MIDDTISRQATIDSIEQHKTAVLEGYEYDEGIAYGYAAAHRHLVDIVKQLPSAQPNLQQTCFKTEHDDTVSRQVAIDALTDENIIERLDSVYDSELHRFKRATQRIIAQLPSAQPERKMGRWIVHYECPKCGEITKDFTEYCPFCNADMRGEEYG